jgi:hypothetical protein
LAADQLKEEPTRISCSFEEPVQGRHIDNLAFDSQRNTAAAERDFECGALGAHRPKCPSPHMEVLAFDAKAAVFLSPSRPHDVGAAGHGLAMAT